MLGIEKSTFSRTFEIRAAQDLRDPRAAGPLGNSDKEKGRRGAAPRGHILDILFVSTKRPTTIDAMKIQVIGSLQLRLEVFEQILHVSFIVLATIDCVAY